MSWMLPGSQAMPSAPLMPAIAPFRMPTRATKTSTMAPTCRATFRPSLVPRAAASITLPSRSTDWVGMRPMVSGCSVSGSKILASITQAGAVIATAASRCSALAAPSCT